MKRIFLVLPPQVHMLDLGGPMQVLGAVAALGISPLALHCVGPLQALTSFQGLALSGIQALPARLAPGDVVIVVGFKLVLSALSTPEHRKIVDWLQAVVQPRLGEVTLASVCTGAFLLGAAGLLDGRSCTTHHEHLARLQQRHPHARVLAGRVLVEDGALITSAGVTAGIDLALHLIRHAFGAPAAIQVARENVVPFRRLGQDPALDAQLRYRDHHHPVIHAVQDFLTRQPACELSYSELAGRFALSYRHLARLFQQECGVTLKQYQQQLRLDLARRLLKDSDWAVELVAQRCGFASPQALRAAWRQEEAVPPSRWRSQA
ncbi:GlxA family transcriptional regulator [Cupriavidus basilensis]|uniref:GlxA family transcriptional regulator n=1 Tax=Cupriavidus basilensis TaxID=68895 RepID=UPI0020A6A25B|nr:helix-turn-helix domain-containing protein [Cupriavidus basilensis]MCP3023752.1 helix-turn-helix domain-containing protein [Cupriavidus basilensis]